MMMGACILIHKAAEEVALNLTVLVLDSPVRLTQSKGTRFISAQRNLYDEANEHEHR